MANTSSSISATPATIVFDASTRPASACATSPGTSPVLPAPAATPARRTTAQRTAAAIPLTIRPASRSNRRPTSHSAARAAASRSREHTRATCTDRESAASSARAGRVTSTCNSSATSRREGPVASSALLPSEKVAAPADAANRVAQFGQAAYSFDEHGQTTTKADAQGTTVYQWDARGRLTHATLPDGRAVSYGYDALGRLASRASGGATTTSLYSNGEVVLDRTGAAQV